jgi:hypothetical protein
MSNRSVLVRVRFDGFTRMDLTEWKMLLGVRSVGSESGFGCPWSTFFFGLGDIRENPTSTSGLLRLYLWVSLEKD